MSLQPVPVNSLARHFGPFQQQLIAAASEVIRSGYYVLGPGVSEFEAAFAAYCGVEHGIGVANGTDALELALKAVGASAGDQVAVCANAAMYSTTAVLACNCVPVFIDVEPASCGMDPVSLQQSLTAHGDLKAVIVTHLYGQLARVRDIVEMCRPLGIAVIEDCAQAHGARLPDGRRAGALADVASFSFYPTKNLGALGDGGAVVTNNAEIAARVRRLRQYGWTEKYTNGLAGGRNSRLDEIQARMLMLMLPLLDDWNTRRRDIAKRYSDEIRNADIIVPAASGDDYVAHLYVVRSSRRDALRKHLGEHGIQTDVHYPLPDHRQPCHAGRFDTVTLPVTETHAASVLTLPCFPELSESEVQRVIDACNRF
jgi:dTDP-4-amino-4,6-dideoxygalactose transaminase